MSDANQQLLAIAQSVANTYAANKKAKAAVVVGSVARRQADPFSDIDMTVMYEEMPTEEEIQAGREALNGADWKRFPGGEADAVADSFLVNGVECQVGHVTLERFEKDFYAPLREYSTEHEQHVIVGGILDAIPLYGADLITRWQQDAAEYPEELARAMVKQHLKVPAFWVLEKRIATRDALFLMHEFLMNIEKDILALLSGLSHIYPQLHYKRLDAYVARMKYAPPDLAARLRRILGDDPAKALEVLRALIYDVFALVETQMPEIDTAEARAKFEQPARQINVAN